MGLDMYLKKKTYIGAEYEHRQVKGTVKITAGGNPVKINFKRISEIVESVGYWRKANHIHKWFVENCQDGVDDCREAYVNKEQLEELLAICKKVKASKGEKQKAMAELPTQEGFFFGGTEIDGYYFEEVDRTIKIIEGLFKEGIEGSEIYYQSSW
jgi:hypothetical protein